MKRNLSYRKAVKLIGVPQACVICGFVFLEETKKPMTSTSSVPHQPTIGHILARSKGGLSTADNIQWECYVCNQAKGNG